MHKKLPMLEEPVEGRICWLCEYIYFSNGSPGYSDMTPGYDATLSCTKDYWEVNFFDDSLEEFRKKITSAERCADFRKRDY